MKKHVCSACGRELTGDERGLNLKSVSSDESKHLCLDCLSAKYKKPRSDFERAIEQFRKAGCPLF